MKAERLTGFPEISSEEWVLSPREEFYFDRLKERCLREGRPMVIWGWKRDKVVDHKRQPESRTVYFTADFKKSRGCLAIERGYFFLETRAKVNEIENLRQRVQKSFRYDSWNKNVLFWPDRRFPGYARMRITIGEPTPYDISTLKRRLSGKPRLFIPEPQLVPECTDYNLSRFAPFALCAGSGLSSEAGLPLLGTIHNLFEVDNPQTGELVFGQEDHLPERVVNQTDKEFIRFCEFSIEVLRACPSDSHYRLAELCRKGIIRQVFTDNMDDLFDKVGISFIPTRLSIFPDRYSVRFDQEVKSLLIIGVAVDRRLVIRQARRSGLKIISINPVLGVAPHSRNMDYLRPGDLLFKEPANQALPKIIRDSGF